MISDLIKSGTKIDAGCIYLFFKNSESKKAAFCVSNKLGNAVVRNKFKRWLRELYRTKKYEIKGSHMVAFLVSNLKADVNFEEFSRSFQIAVNKLNKQK